MVHIHVADGSAGLTVGTHIGQVVVGTKSLAIVCGTYASCDVEFLGHDIVPDGIDSIDIGRVARESSHIGHTGIHVGSAHGVTYGLILLHHGLVAL